MSSRVYEVITQAVIEKMKQGKVLWHQPWRGLEPPKNLISKRPYRGVNIFTLILAGYGSPYFVTFKQCKELGGRVKKGERGNVVLYWNWQEKEITNAEGETQKKKFAFLRYYLVFNVEQTEGLEKHVPEVKHLNFKPIEEAERIIREFKHCPKIKHERPQAFYTPRLDYINMPTRESFESVEEYYSTFFHELTHSTGHESRLNRKGITEATPFGTENYSKEELVAELGCAYLCGITGIENKTINNSVAYLQGWLERLQSDPRLIVHAASAAQKAVDYILGQEVNENNKEPEEIEPVRLALAA